MNFQIYLETYLKPQNVRDLIRRKVGNGNDNYFMEKAKPLPLYYLAYMVKKRTILSFSLQHSSWNTKKMQYYTMKMRQNILNL